jgi:hypothetical protein
MRGALITRQGYLNPLKIILCSAAFISGIDAIRRLGSPKRSSNS